MFKTILAPLTGTDCDEQVLQLGLRLARSQNAHIECLPIFPELTAEKIREAGLAASLVFAALNVLEDEQKGRSQSAHDNFISFCETANVLLASDPPGFDTPSISWRGATDAGLIQTFRLSRYHDVVVLAAGHLRPGWLSEGVLGQVIIGSGRPVVLAPACKNTGPFDVIAVAWKDSAEAARSVAAAMPLLNQAEHIEIFSAAEASDGPGDNVVSLENILRYFRWHGFDVSGHVVTPGLRSAPEAVLDAASDAKADLLVMGGYGHARLREIIFGGFTQHVLGAIELPVLIFH